MQLCKEDKNMRTAIKVFIAMVCIFWEVYPIACAQPMEWKEEAYNFTKVKTVLILEPEFIYDGYDVSGNDKFYKYPDTQAKIGNMLTSRWKKITGFRYVTLPYIIEQMKADPDTPVDAVLGPNLSEAVIKAMPKYADLVVFTEIHDFGWFHRYCEPYDATETVIDRVRYGGVTPDGKEYSGWMEVPRSVLVHHDASYTIYDSAEVRFQLVDASSWKKVWKYSEDRNRLSISFSRDYDSSGPESVMNRILNVAFDKLPMLHQDSK
jgi:hypothetical protein